MNTTMQGAMKKKNQKNIGAIRRNKALWGGALLAIVFIATVLFFWQGKYQTYEMEHVHGIAAEEDVLYIATHHGLFLLENEQLKKRSEPHDLMGLALHPRQRGVLYASGHPKEGGNLGVVRSDDAGKTWKKISDAERGPADFHALSVSRTNPSLLYGWYAMMIQHSADGGKTWEITATNMAPVTVLAASPTNENLVLGVAPAGIIRSTDRGKNWEILPGTQKAYFITITPGAQAFYGYAGKLGIAKSVDGISWQTLTPWPDDDQVTHLTISTTNPSMAYAVTQKNNIYKSDDNGKTWKQVAYRK